MQRGKKLWHMWSQGEAVMCVNELLVAIWSKWLIGDCGRNKSCWRLVHLLYFKRYGLITLIGIPIHVKKRLWLFLLVRSSSARSLLHRKFERYANQRSTISYHMLLAKDVAFDLAEKVVSGLKVSGGVTKVKCCHKGRQTNQGRKFWLYTITGGYSGSTWMALLMWFVIQTCRVWVSDLMGYCKKGIWFIGGGVQKPLNI